MHCLRTIAARRMTMLVAVLLGACAETAAPPTSPTGVPGSGPSLAKGPGSGNSRRIVFVSNQDGTGLYRIHSMKPDGTDINRLSNSATSEAYPAVSPDGTRIVYTCPGFDPRGEICVMNADGTGVTRLTTSPGIDIHPSWSPDGTKIVFVSSRGSSDHSNIANTEIYVMNANGFGITRLTNTPATDIYPAAADGSPAWSPDGTKIAFLSSRMYSNPDQRDIYLMNPDGSQVQRLVPLGAGYQELDRLSWDSEGKRLAYSSNNNLMIMHVPTRAITQVGVGLGKRPSWAPNDAKLAFQKHENGNSNIYLVNVDGSGETRLTVSPLADEWPVWAR
jgi:Tol biopolymer transport system component